MNPFARFLASLGLGRSSPVAPPAQQTTGVPVIAVGEAPQAPFLPPAALEMVARHEGYRATAYKCPAGVWTIGYGTTRWSNGQAVRDGDGPVDQFAAKRLLMHDLRWAADAVRDLVTVELTEHQRSALISFVYNVGRKAFSNSTLLGLLNAGDYRGAAEQFERWNKGGGKVLPGLVARRAEEASLFSGKAGRVSI